MFESVHFMLITSETDDAESIISFFPFFPANSPVRIAALHFTDDTVTIRLLLEPAFNRDARSLECPL